MNAKSLGFATGSFDIVICGFMGWDDCFDFANGEFTQPDAKTKEIWRVLRDGGKFICCSWEEQEDLRWMEEAMIRHFPAILDDRDYLEQRPIGMSYEKAAGYETIFRRAGFREIEILRQPMTFVSTDEEEWWRQMQHLGWEPLTKKIENVGRNRLQKVKQAIFEDLQCHKQVDGIHFEKVAFFIHGLK